MTNPQRLEQPAQLLNDDNTNSSRLFFDEAFDTMRERSPVPSAENRAAPQENVGIQARLTQQDVRNAFANLDADSFRLRESAHNLLRNGGPEILPELARALESPPSSLEARRRVENIAGRVQSEQLPLLLDALSNPDKDIRAGARDLVGRMQTRSFLEAATRDDLTEGQTAALRRLVTARNTPEELARQYAKPDGNDLRAALGAARLFDPASEPRLSNRLGLQLMTNDTPESLAEAGRLFERAAQRATDPADRFNALRDLATTRALQDDPAAFRDAFRRLAPELQRMAANPNEAETVDQAYQQLIRATGHTRTFAPARDHLEAAHNRFLAANPREARELPGKKQ